MDKQSAVGDPPAYDKQGYQALPQPTETTVLVRQPQQPIPNDHLAFAIFVAICCCLPFGIVGIVMSSRVRSSYAMGDYQGAEESSRLAKNWSLTGLVLGSILLALYVIVMIGAVA